MSRVDFWKDKANEVVDPKLFSDKADSVARNFGKENAKNKKVNNISQIRKFYDEVVRLNQEAKQGTTVWPNIEPRVNMLVAKAAYANGRGLVCPGFLDFVKSSVQQVTSSKDLELWTNFFEATMGFLRFYEEQRKMEARRR